MHSFFMDKGEPIERVFPQWPLLDLFFWVYVILYITFQLLDCLFCHKNCII